MIDYPIKLKPILKEKIWGGRKLVEVLQKDSNIKKLGESWEISGHEGDVSVVENGPLQGRKLDDLIKEYQGDFVGEKIYKKFGNKFPLLIKFIDARENLSVQLHPDDQMAMERHNSFGKTEMWVIIDADEDSEIIMGFKPGVDKKDYLTSLESGNLENILNSEKVKKGDAFFIGPGKVHAIGAGILLAEIQQTSDITYRIFDYNRRDDSGELRELHTEQAIDAIDFKKQDYFELRYEKKINQASNVAQCKYFTTNYIAVNGKVERDFNNLDSFVIYMCLKGEAEITLQDNSETFTKGQSLLLPANCDKAVISSENCELLEIYVE